MSGSELKTDKGTTQGRGEGLPLNDISICEKLLCVLVSNFQILYWEIKSPEAVG